MTEEIYSRESLVSIIAALLKKYHAEIPWEKISGLRHRLVRDYENTNWSLICAVLFDVLPRFLQEIEKIIA